MIEVGEYVINQNRLVIGQIIEINEERQEAIIKTDTDKVKIPIGFWNIKKHSKNIIDLIEVGDIVFIEDFSGYDFIYINDKEMLEALKQDVKDGVRIKSILTKELYQANCYTVERKEKC